MSNCSNFNPDNVFKRFKVVEFPPSFVNLSTPKILDVEVDIIRSAYLKTMYRGKLMKFEDAREISASHRAFNIMPIDDRTIEISFQPKSECIARSKRTKPPDNRFVFDLRLIQVDEVKCCNAELHSEIGRYYISGEYEYSKISHYPKIINFGDVAMNQKVTKYVRIRNDSNLIAAKMSYERTTCFYVSPASFTIAPNSSIRIAVSAKPTSFNVAKTFIFRVRNPHDGSVDKKIGASTKVEDDNYIHYIIDNKINISFNKVPKDTTVESLHKLYDQLPNYTYINEEVKIHKERKAKAITYLEACKSALAKKPPKEKFTTGRDICYSDTVKNVKLLNGNFCKKVEPKVSPYELFNIIFFPLSIDFGKVAVYTYGKNELTIKNKTKYIVTIKLFQDDCILYTENMLHYTTIKLKSLEETKLTIFCQGFVEGCYKGTIDYTIDDTYYGKHPYSLDVGNPLLTLQERCLKFGMTTSDTFVTSVPVRIYNNFNISVNFKWSKLDTETPFEIKPLSGSIPSHGCKICAVIYISKPTKTKVHEVNLISESTTINSIPIELSVITRKLSIKFLQQCVTFKDIPLNLTTIEKVKLENSSREIALFHVVEPLIPGLKIEPMSGIIKPKIVMTFDIIVKISCVMEFNIDVYIKINNKENVMLPISGNVVEPRITINPKHIYMSRIPCNMITYVPVTFQNLGPGKCEVEILDTGDDNIFDVYMTNGINRERLFKFVVEAEHSIVVYIKVYDIFRREYEMYIPFKINGLLGPPNQDPVSIELQHYIGEFEHNYENNTRTKLKNVNKDISYCRINGVITVPWIQLSIEKFEMEYCPCARNELDFTMTNVSKYYLYVAISISKLAPNFSLELKETLEEGSPTRTESIIKFELDQNRVAEFVLHFHPKSHGRFVSTAILYLDKHLTIPYYNLTFFGKREAPLMTPSTYRVIFPPCRVGEVITRIITIELSDKSDLDKFSCVAKTDSKLSVAFVDYEVVTKDDEFHTIVTVELKIIAESPILGDDVIHFKHDCGSICDVRIYYCVTHCILTLHAHSLVSLEDNPYPYYPLSSQTILFQYLERCKYFLEKWMFQQGFRRDLYPDIPDTFHVISSSLSTQNSPKTKGINVSYLNFVRRIAGPLMKHVRKIIVQGVDESFKYIKEIHDTYREIISLLRSRGANLYALQATFLLSYEHFVVYSQNVTPKCNADIILTQQLISDINLFQRLNKQSWLDFILQSYKVFVLDSCFFECVCVSIQQRDIIQILLDWFNEQMLIKHKALRGKEKPVRQIANITTDLCDGIALASAIMNYCPFLTEHFSLFCEVQEASEEGDIINNACLIIEAMNLLRLYFPISVKDFLNPNYLQMLFLCIHLYVVLPMFKTTEIIRFSPPLLRSSSRQVSIGSSSQEALTYSHIILYNNRNSFFAEKAPAAENGKKIFLTVRFTANFVTEESSILLVHGFNKTRIFDTYITFILHGEVGILNPLKKCKVTGPLYRPNKVEVQVGSPFLAAATFRILITDIEPTIPVYFEEIKKPRFFLRRLNLIEKEINLPGAPKEGQEVIDHKLHLLMICLSTVVGNSWIWFVSDIGQFFIRVTTQPRWDLAVESLTAKVETWPMDPCSCGEACECYRTTVLMIPHRNELMVKAMRYALLEYASDTMMHIFDRLIESTTGRIILTMLLEEGGTCMSEVDHIMLSEVTFKLSSRTLMPRMEQVVLSQYSNDMLALPITIPAEQKIDKKYSITLTSECGMDIRIYKIFFVESIADMPI